MKNCILLFSVLLLHCPASAQLGKELFTQQKTGLQYLDRQLASFKSYTVLTEQGYALMATGWNLIGNIRDSLLRLHRNYYLSLGKTPPALLRDPRIASIVSFALSIADQYGKDMWLIKITGDAPVWMQHYIKSVFGPLINASAEALLYLSDLTGSGTFRMTDGQRMRCIDAVYRNMKVQYTFSLHFGETISLLIGDDLNKREAAKTFETLYGNHQ